MFVFILKKNLIKWNNFDSVECKESLKLRKQILKKLKLNIL